jgi:signal transduction histidine kinase
MRCPLFFLFIALLFGTAHAEPLQDLSQSELEQRLDDIDTRLGQLARSTLRSGVGPIGYRSYGRTEATGKLTWIEIDLQASVAVDEVILVPAIWRDPQSDFRSDAFPPAFRILNEQGEVLADVQTTDKELPRIAPLVVPTFGKTASKIRIEIEQLCPRAFDGMFLIQFAEVLVFSGPHNAALRQPVTTSRTWPYHNNEWQPRFLTDGSLPYLMHAAKGEQSIAYLSPVFHSEGVQVAPTIDLQQSVPVTGIHLHLVDQGDTVPQGMADGVGMPHKLLIEGANLADFSDARALLEVEAKSAYDLSPIMMWNLPETTCRYIRFTALEPYLFRYLAKDLPRIGFAEIEIHSKGSNVAAGKSILIDEMLFDENRPLTALTDGRNLYGNILPIRDWLKELAERHDLETERPLIAAELQRHYARQKSTVRIMSWLFALIAAGIIIAVLIERNIRQRAIFRTRERIAADLHDELGANLHAIGMLGDLVQKSQGTPERLAKLLQRMREITDRTGNAARYCANMLEDEQRYVDIADNMRRTADRLTADLAHELTFEGESLLTQLSARKRIDLFLFYKESLANIIRHSGATHVTTRLTINPKQLELIITDNGSGLNGNIPPSLKRRARLLGGQVSTSPHTPHGTQIILQRRFRRRLRPSPNSEN